MRRVFGKYVRERRMRLLEQDPKYSVRRVAQQISVEPSYLSKVERGETPPPSEAKIIRLAKVLDEDPDMLLALAGRVATDLQKVIQKRPKMFAELVRQLKKMPDDSVRRLVREVRDGKW